MAEVQAMTPRRSQYHPDMDPIPEKSWAYRFAKKFAFHEYGVYEENFQGGRDWIDPDQVDVSGSADQKESVPPTYQIRG